MDFKLIHFVSENWLQAMGVTLFHSLWIGVVLSVITAVIMLLTRKSSAALRYQLLTGCLCLFVLAIGITLYIEFDRTSVSSSAVATTIDLKKGGELAIQPLQQQITKAPIDISGKIDQLLKLWNSYAAQIVLVWFLIICAKSVHLLLGLNTIFYLKRNKIFEAGKLWENKLIALADKLEIRQKVKIVQSGIAEVPMVAGHFKPLILIPLGLLNGLSIAEVEAILCHELAHIKRRDYLVNLLQSFIEIIFFFNPAVLWLSKLIRTERENCCDDLALTCVADKKSYVKALLSCQEFQMKTPEYAMALTGRKSDLLNRVSRMLFNTKSTLNKMEKTILTLAMVFVFLFSAAFSNAENKQVAPVKKQILNQDTAKKKLQKIAPSQSSTSSKTKSITIIKEQLSAKEQAEMDEAEAKFAAAQKEYEANEQKYKLNEKEYAKNEAKYAEAEKEYVKNQLKYKANQDKYAKDEAMYQQNEHRYQAAQDQHKRDAKRYTQDSLRYEKHKKDIYPQTPATPQPLSHGMVSPAPMRPVTPVQPANLKLKSSPVAVAEPISLPVNVNVSAPISPATPLKPSKTATSSRKSVSLTDGGGVDSDELSDRINDELLKDGIISQTKQLSYKLDKDGLCVNGKKQSEEISSKYKLKYLKASTSALLYNYEVNISK